MTRSDRRSSPPYVHEHRVGYAECDPMGIVHHAEYLKYFETARTEMLRNHGLTYHEMEEDGFLMPVIHADIRYLRSAFYDDLLSICTWFSLSDSGVRAYFDYEIRRGEEEQPLTSAALELVFMDAERRRPVRAPESLLRIAQES